MEAVAAPPFIVEGLKIILGRLILVWKPWTAKNGDRKGDAFLSPFGGFLFRAVTLDGIVVYRPQIGPESVSWTAVPVERVTSGRWVLYETIDGVDKVVFHVTDRDTGHFPLDNRLLKAARECFDCISDRQKMLEDQYKEAELDVAAATRGAAEGGSPVPEQIRRDPQQQAWRARAEEMVRDISAHEYNLEYAHYQNNPTKEPRGEKHKAGFVIIDKRTHHVTAA